MSGNLISALALLLSGCAVVTATGTEEAVRFSGENAGVEEPRLVLKPHDDLPLTLEFSCPTKIATMMTSVFIPFPPAMPVGFVNKQVSYLHIRAPKDVEHAIGRISIVTPQGTSIALPDDRDSKRVAASGEMMEIIYTLRENCETFDGASLKVAGFSYKDRRYPATHARLQFDSRLRGVVGPGLT